MWINVKETMNRMNQQQHFRFYHLSVALHKKLEWILLRFIFRVFLRYIFASRLYPQISSIQFEHSLL